MNLKLNLGSVMLFLNQNFILSEKVRAKCVVDEFLDGNPSIIEIQTYVQMARNDLALNKNDVYSQEIIKLLSGE